MPKWKKQSHVVYQCSYHIVWCPKYRFRILEGAVGKYVEERIRTICEWKASEIEELSVIEDDAVFLSRTSTWVSYTLERLPADWELLYLGYRDGELRGFVREFQELFGRRRNSADVVSRSVGRGLRTAGGHDYTHAYAVTNGGARKLLEGGYTVSHTADGWLEHKVLEQKVIAYITVPKIFAQQEEFGSSIHRT